MATVKGEGGAQTGSRTFTSSPPAEDPITWIPSLVELQISSRSIQAPWTLVQPAPLPILGTLITPLKLRYACVPEAGSPVCSRSNRKTREWGNAPSK